MRIFSRRRQQGPEQPDAERAVAEKTSMLSWSEALPRLRTQLAPYHGRSEQALIRPVSRGDVAEQVVIDLPMSIHPVTKTQFLSRGVDEDAVFTAARESVRRYVPVNAHRYHLTDAPEYELVYLTGSDYYTSAYAVMLDSVCEIERRGCLVAAPAASLVIATTLDPDRSLIRSGHWLRTPDLSTAWRQPKRATRSQRMSTIFWIIRSTKSLAQPSRETP
ncbi:hypothetical protein ACQP2F_15660 [Actinoplanes sp. CA-030573]|uniref:hypothetical protein n=1 Tax=Actinoplanes sp. CA-030573 TaxID=3239898 RepID=UPI003D913BF6